MKRCQGEDSTLCEAGAGVYGYETGWKDAVIATPNFTTTIRMRFDILGIYGELIILCVVYTLLSSLTLIKMYPYSFVTPQFGTATFSLMKTMR